jgi:hypothetical protein
LTTLHITYLAGIVASCSLLARTISPTLSGRA